MDAYLSTSQASPNTFGSSPVLIAADSAKGKARALRSVTMAGLRVADAISVEAAPERLERQAATSALWIELEADCGRATERLLDQVAADISRDRYSAVIAAPAALLDRIGGLALEAGFNVIIDADEAERAAALALAVSGAMREARVSDIAGDKSAAQLRQLSEDVSRIASTLARLSTGPDGPVRRPAEAAPVADAPAVAAETVRSVIRARRVRSRYFSEELFAHPAWDMLRDLLQAEIAQLRVPVSSLCIAASVPATTALRWLKSMVQQGLFMRRADPHDGRRIFVELAPEASHALRRYFAEVGRVAVV
jgi:DNA-binding MarR family transcriptional regulator